MSFRFGIFENPNITSPLPLPHPRKLSLVFLLPQRSLGFAHKPLSLPPDPSRPEDVGERGRRGFGGERKKGEEGEETSRSGAMTSTSEKLLQVVDYKLLPRRRLQQLCKKHGIPANKTNLFMAEALSGLAVLQVTRRNKG